MYAPLHSLSQLSNSPIRADDYGALEPSISGKIMELHHKNHHQTYVNGFNTASEQLAAAEQKQDIQAQIALQPLINFHGGGHVNHTLFWENLAPSKQGGGGQPSGKVKVCHPIDSRVLGLADDINRPQSNHRTATSHPSRPSSILLWQASKGAGGHG
jgi:hypothetical protein